MEPPQTYAPGTIASAEADEALVAARLAVAAG
jgi:hypothetical protein